MTSFRSPGFPIYKANIIPFIENGQQSYTKEMKKEHVDKWDEALDSLRQFIQSVVNMASGLNDVQRLELVGDMISFYLKAPLIRPPLLGLAPAPYLFYPIIRTGHAKIETQHPIKFLKNIFDYSDAVKSLQKHLLNKLSELTELWFTIPADTRPLYNTSSLLSHLLLTSTIAWSYAVENGYSREDGAKLRLAAMFHDISKPYDFEKHYQHTEVVEKVLSGILGDNQLNDLAEFVREHHFEGATGLSSILNRADRLAAASDRLSTLTDNIFGPTDDVDRETGYGSGKQAWEHWRRVYEKNPDSIRMLSEKAAKKLSEPETLMKLRTMEDVQNHELRLCQIDIGGIQEFIMRTRDLRSVAASSLVIDMVTSTQLPILIQHEMVRRCGVWIPHEAFIIISGGTLTLLLPQKIANELENSWRYISIPLEEIGLRAFFASASFTGNYYRDSGELAGESYIRKLTSEPAAQTIVAAPISGASPSLCTSCYRDPPAPNDDKCHTCRELYEVGSSIHFKKKWDTGVRISGVDMVPEKVFGNWGDEQSFDVMYVVAGHRTPSQEPGERVRNVAVVKLDGNLMGEFFANSVSISDMIERSARVDIALKDALEKSLIDLFNGVGGLDPEDAIRSVASCFLGLLYAGGDDALLLCPSWCSIILAQRIAHYFAESMGRVRTLSVGIASAPPRHDVWALIDAASALLDDAKRVGREQGSGGGVAFDYIEGGVLTRSTAAWRKALARQRHATLQPFTIQGLREFFAKLEIPLDGPQAFAYAYQASREGENDRKKHLKGLRQKVIESAGVPQTIGMPGQENRILVTHLARMANVGNDEEKGKYLKLLRLVSTSSDHGTPLVPFFDVDVLIKFLGGGMI